MNPRELLQFVSDEGIKMVDLRFVDLPGLWQHFSISANEMEEEMFEEGVGFDGSSIRGFQEIQESDMILIPDASTAFKDPFTAVPTLNIICNVKDPVTLQSYTRDPRHIAQKAENYLRSTGIGDTAYFGPEPEFFVLDDIRFDQSYNYGYYYVDSKEGFWNSGKEENPNLGYKPRYKEGYFPVPPMDSLQDIRSEMVLLLEEIGVQVEVHHHEVGTAGQCEIDMRFDTLTSMADKFLKYKYIIKERRTPAWKDRHLDAQADLSGQRVGNAHPHQYLEGREECLLRTRRLRGPEQDGRLLHRRNSQAHARPVGLLRTDDQFLPSTGSRI